MLSARSPKYPALYDEESGVRFRRGKAVVTEEQAQILAKRRFMDGILIGEFDDEGFSVNELPAKKWAQVQAGDSGGEDQNPDAPPGPDTASVEPPTDDATGQGRRRRTPKE